MMRMVMMRLMRAARVVVALVVGLPVLAAGVAAGAPDIADGLEPTK